MYYFEYQIILRLYNSPSEIIHGFDIDCCSVGYDGKDIWMTQRCLFSLMNGYNSVNFNRMSPSYHYRLAKYGSRGMAVKVPDFERNKIKMEELISFIDTNDRKDINGVLHGIDVLLYLEYIWIQSKHKLRSIFDPGQECSDYSYVPIVKRSKYSMRISHLVEYLACSSNNHKKYSEKYLPFIYEMLRKGMVFLDYFDSTEDKSDDVKLTEAINFQDSEDFIYDGLKDIGNLQIHRILKCKKIMYIMCISEDLHQILNISPILYECLKVLRPWDFPADLTFKITNPGEQMTNTFNKLVLNNTDTWYQGKFYSFMQSMDG